MNRTETVSRRHVGGAGTLWGATWLGVLTATLLCTAELAAQRRLIGLGIGYASWGEEDASRRGAYAAHVRAQFAVAQWIRLGVDMPIVFADDIVGPITPGGGTCGNDVVFVATAGPEFMPYGGLYAGAQAGVVYTTVGHPGGSGFFKTCQNKSARFGFAYLLKAGYDFRLSDRWAIGPYFSFYGGPAIPGADSNVSWSVLSIGVMGVFKPGAKSTEEPRPQQELHRPFKTAQ